MRTHVTEVEVADATVKIVVLFRERRVSPCGFALCC